MNNGFVKELLYVKSWWPNLEKNRSKTILKMPAPRRALKVKNKSIISQANEWRAALSAVLTKKFKKTEGMVYYIEVGDGSIKQQRDLFIAFMFAHIVIKLSCFSRTAYLLELQITWHDVLSNDGVTRAVSSSV